MKLHKTIEKQLGLSVHSVVFWTSVIIIAMTLGMSMAYLESAQEVFGALQNGIAEKTGWFFILSVNGFLIFVLYLMFSRYGDIKLGAPDEKPEFHLWGWFAMLFSAGMGIGLLFYGVAEPMFHYMSPPMGESATVESAKLAMGLTFLHWGFHGWAVYAIVGLALAFFSFRKGLPLTIRSVFYPILKERIHGPIGNVIDVLAVVATLFGLTTSLGLGSQQVNTGLHYLFGIEKSLLVQGLLIAVITGMATISVVLGVDRGIRRLSEWNLLLGLLLLAFLFVVGPSSFLLDSFVQNTGYYLGHLIELSTWTESYEQTTWQHGWTIFYWGWWVAWSPFVGMFIARVSKGRSIREFLLGVLFVPTSLSFLWFTVFGGTAIHQELFVEAGIAKAVQADVSTALFVLLERFPWSFVMSLMAMVIVINFFVTSSDSGSLVIDIITAGGDQEPPARQRVFWAITEGTVAFILLAAGGLKALQTASITTGLPFTVVLIVMAYSLLKGLKEEKGRLLSE